MIDLVQPTLALHRAAIPPRWRWIWRKSPGRSTPAPCRPRCSTRSGWHSLGQARHSRQHHPHAAAAQISRAQSGRKYLAVHARQPRLPVPRGHRRPLLPWPGTSWWRSILIRSSFRATAWASAPGANAVAFMTDLSERLANRVQLRRMRSAPMSMQSSGHSVRISITAKRLNFTRPKRLGPAATLRRRL
jgi:hypothetical protein